MYFFCVKIYFTFTNSADPDEIQHYAAFHLGLHCLQMYLFRVSPQGLKNPLVSSYFTVNIWYGQVKITSCLPNKMIYFFSTMGSKFGWIARN